MSKNYKLTGIEPVAVWKYFYEISQIPRESGNNEGITKYLLAFCEEHNIEAFAEKLERLYPSVKYVNRLITHSWGQKVIRFYDLDGNLIEVGTPM